MQWLWRAVTGVAAAAGMGSLCSGPATTLRTPPRAASLCLTGSERMASTHRWGPVQAGAACVLETH